MWKLKTIFPLFCFFRRKSTSVKPSHSSTDRKIIKETVQMCWCSISSWMTGCDYKFIADFFLCVFSFTFHQQGTIPLRGWAVEEMGPRTFRSTSKKTDLLHWRQTLRPVLGNMVSHVDALLSFRWFEGFNWDGLCKHTLNPPVIPRVRSIQCVISVCCISKAPLSLSELFLSLFLSFRFNIFWIAVHVIITPRAQWSWTQTGMISNGLSVYWNKNLSILQHLQVKSSLINYCPQSNCQQKLIIFSDTRTNVPSFSECSHWWISDPCCLLPDCSVKSL